MSCTEIQPELVGYHFGEVEEELRCEIEAHLLGCRDCLEEYLSLKREIETAGTGLAPSREARERLRRAVARQVRGPSPARPWSWWERPVAFLFAGAAVMVAFLVLQVVSTGIGSAPRTLSESSRPVPTGVR